ncbi:cytochrome P450 [Trametes elegans]|nr:cytochrome P450 [Trametes elegans]
MIPFPLIALAVWFLWRIFRSLLARSPLSRIPGPPPASALAGNLLQLLDRNGWDFHADIAEKYGSVVKLNWLFGAPMLYIFDTVALRHILKDTETYDEPAWWLQSNRLMLGPGVISVNGDMHRRQRKMLTPLFSPKHLRSLVPVFHQVADKLIEAISSRIPEQSADIDVAGWMGRAALELIGQAGIGYSFDPLTSDVADAYAEAVNSFLPLTTSPELMLLRQAVPYVAHIGPAWFRRWVLERLPIKCVQRTLYVTDTIYAGSLKIFTEKKAALLAGKHADAKDIMTILLKANMEASEKDRLPDDELLGQMSSIIFAAMDSTSNALSRILHVLAERPDVQDKLRHHIREARARGPLDYDALHTLPYLDAVCKETFRLYSPAPQTFRRTMKDAVLPLYQPVRAADGTVMNELVIPAGTNLFLGMLSCNRYKALWGDDAYEWKPERWLGPVPDTVEKASVPGVYNNLMTFLGGTRSCIGFHFSLLEMKVVLSELIANFAFEPSDKPIFWNMSGLTYPSTSAESTRTEMWLKMTKVGAD